ncbi:MAG: L-asparaginase [Saprospiraceae bacterium]
MKKNILILYTGGTFGMQQTERGLAPSGNLTERIAPILQPYEDQDISWQVQSLSPLLDSANMQGKYWVQMADLIVAAPDADAVLLIHGTDSMAYTASALTYLLHQRFALPLIITGSQFPLGTENGDAEGNLKNAIEHCIETETGVFVSFAGELIPGARSSKINANALVAFGAPKHETMQAQTTAIGFDFTQDKRSFIDLNIGVIRITPALNVKQVDALLSSPLDALILEGYGVGTLPEQNVELVAALESANKAGTIIMAITQCHGGHVDLGLYATSQAMLKINAINGGDMTVEAALTKLMVLHYLGYPKNMIRTLAERNICGEMNHV